MRYFIIVFLLSIVHIDYSHGCSCDKLKRLTKNDLNKSEVIFIGTVLEVTIVDDHTMKTRFSIEEKLSNDTVLKKEYIIWSAFDCAPKFEVGKKWYIFGYFYDNKQWSSICSRSAELSDRIIPPNPYKNKYQRQAQRDFNKNRSRAKSEINYIRKLNKSKSNNRLN